MSVSPEVAQKILEADLINIGKKVAAGKSLTTAERAVIHATQEGTGKREIKPFATTIVELSEQLGVTRRSVTNWIKLEGAPKPAANGEHNVVAWKEFVKARGLKQSEDGPDRNALQSSKILREVELLDMELAEKRGELVNKRIFIEDLTRVFAAMKVELESIELISPQLAGLPTHEIAKRLREFKNEVLQQLADCKWIKHLKP